MSPARPKKPASKSRSSKPNKASKAHKGKPRKKGGPRPLKLHRKLAAVEAPKPMAENPRAKELAQKIANFVLDKKALDVVILDVRGMTSYADYFVLASGESERQVSAMAENVMVQLKQGGEHAVGSEGFETGRWVLLDYGEVVAHSFFQDVRGFYDLDGLWADEPREMVA